MTLVLEIDHLTGHVYAAQGPESDAPDWPPRPDRVFSALVATWAARGQSAAEAAALKWLEAQEVPRIVAAKAEPRQIATVFVPPNDARTGDLSQMPARRRRQPRRFPAAVPEHPVVRLVWPAAEPDAATFAALDALARDTSHVGHSASLTRCRFLGAAALPDFAARMPRQRIYPGRFDELVADFARGRRPAPGARVAPPPPAEDPTPASVFAASWLLLEPLAPPDRDDDDGTDADAARPPWLLPDVRATALVAKAIRDAVLCGYDRAGIVGGRIPEAVSGHAADGAPSAAPHLAVVALPYVGFPNADGHVMGFALVPPRGSGLLDDPDFRAALAAVAPVDDDEGRRVLTVKSRRGSSPSAAFALRLAPTRTAAARSLDADLWARPGRVFATATPIVLDRHPKADGAEREAEVAAIVAAACERIGLPRPKRIAAGKHAALDGAVAARRAATAPAWTGWRLPASLAGRVLTHAVIDFGETVRGPVILGAGRFVGLGLCRTIDREEDT